MQGTNRVKYSGKITRKNPNNMEVGLIYELSKVKLYEGEYIKIFVLINDKCPIFKFFTSTERVIYSNKFLTSSHNCIIVPILPLLLFL